jgi:hypothetical protein
MAIEEAVRAGRAQIVPGPSGAPRDSGMWVRGDGVDFALDAYHRLARERRWYHLAHLAPGVWDYVLGLDPYEVEEHEEEIRAAMREALKGGE